MRRSLRPINAPRGFTLFEVLLALGLVAALSGSVFAFLWQVSSQKSAMTTRAMAGQAGDIVLERMEADLLSAVAADSAGNAGIVGSASSLRVLSRGVALPLLADEAPWSSGDLQGTEYSFASGRLTARRWDAHRHRTGPQGGAEPVHQGVGEFRLRYFDGSEWLDSFDSKSKNALPVAVEVAIWFGPSETIPLSPTATPPDLVGTGDDGALLFSEQPQEQPPTPPRPSKAPDRLRIMVVADGPATTWKELR